MAAENTPKCASVDRTEATWLFAYEELPAWAQTKFHQPRSDDRALAKCSWRIVLNTEDITSIDAIDAPPHSDLCKRCFR